MICKNCSHESYCYMAKFGGHTPPITDCYKFKKRNTTNADRIRAMSDEELAKFITSEYYQPHCPVGSCPVVEDCEECWLDWLKAEVKP